MNRARIIISAAAVFIVSLAIALGFALSGSSGHNSATVPQQPSVSSTVPSIGNGTSSSPTATTAPATTSASVSFENETDVIDGVKYETLSVWLEPTPSSNNGEYFDFVSANSESTYGVAPQLSGTWSAVTETQSGQQWSFTYPGGSLTVSRTASGMPTFVNTTNASASAAPASGTACMGQYDWDGLSGGQQLVVNGQTYTAPVVTLSETTRQDVQIDGASGSVATSGGFTTAGFPYMNGIVTGHTVAITAYASSVSATRNGKQVPTC
jgi:hypothetical protein